MKERVLRMVARFLGAAAKKLVAKLSPSTIVIGVTGSSGKTSTKEAIGNLLKIAFGDNCLVSSGNLNNEIGLPLALLGYKEVPTAWQYPAVLIGAWWRARKLPPKGAYVFEYAVDRPGDMDKLLDIIKPNIAILTNIAPVHLENYPSPKALIAEKLKIVTNLPQNGAVIANGDDIPLKRSVNQLNLAVKVQFFGSSARCEARLTGYKLQSNGTEFTVEHQNKTTRYEIGALGEQHVLAVLPSILVGELLEIDRDTIARALKEYRPLPGRGNIIFGVKDSIIINDTYNANPLSTEKMLEVLQTMPASVKVAVLGDMLELGEASKREHERILALAKKSADQVITVGRRMAEPKLADHSFLSPLEVAQFLKDHLAEGTVLAVKGSQSMRMELIVKELMLDPLKAEELLPRQNKTWLAKPFEPV